MTHLRQLCAVAVLTFALASSAFAGNMECGVVDPPPNPPVSAMGDTATNGTLSTETAFADPFTGFTLNILQSVLSLF
jgi:hypothetical protein